MSIQQSLVRRAADSFARGNYAAALAIYRQLAEHLGKAYFAANIRICEQRMAEAGRRAQQVATPLKQLKIACVMDEFSYHAFAPECELLNLHADHWLEEIEAFRPDFLLIESAWRGAKESWQRKISDPSVELSRLLDWAQAQGVATAFWCKEDPIHFNRFLPVARRADHVFTTDIDCITRYKAALKHDRIHLLPFAAQPALHNPIETEARKDIFSFAGSWYSRYPDRQTDFRTLVGVGRTLKAVEVYDRNANRPPPHDFVFPDEFRDEIRGQLPYTELDRAYKGCRYGITVNTIKQSQTMFARRAFELMACNTVVVSNFSKGLRLMLGDHVIASDSAVELEHRLGPLCTNEDKYRRHRLGALRKVLAEHTYEHRLAYVAGKVLNRPYQAATPHVALLAEPADDAEAAHLLATLERQNWPRATLVLVGIAWRMDHPRVEVIPDRRAALARLNDFDYVAPLAVADYYGPDYLTDLALATRFSAGDGFTKAAFHAVEADGATRLQGDRSQYRPAAAAALRRSLLRPALLTAWADDAAATIDTSFVKSPTLLAIDEFGYCADAALSLATSVDVGPLLRPGLSLPAQLLPRAEAIKPPKETADAAAPIVLKAKEWRSLLPLGIDARLNVRLVNDESVEIESTLPATEYQYLYFSRRFTPTELKAGNDTFFRLEADTYLDVRTVFVFDDANKKKISHAMQTVGARHGFSLPSGTVSIRFALRIQGSGVATLGKLSLAELRDQPTEVLASARHLVVATQYPSYEDLYRFGFVHARVRAYANAGVIAEILRISADPRVVYREFEDVDVTQADAAHFEQCLAGDHYQSILVHIIDQRIWNVLRKYLDRVRVVIWVHGAEIQPWWRRAMNQATDALRDKARRGSDARMAMWREIFSLKHPNLRVVFISHKQAGEALSDLHLPAAELDGIEAISNFINDDLFSYQAKDAALRHRLLSIRPFASRVYANDLTVAAILRLAHEPFFDQLHFRIIGDGVLFDETVAPLREFPNIQIERTFLTHREIAALHRDYGVFLVPSRMDSQGVSRDEAMASGLVPITNRVAAIPEFVDEDCAFLADPEDAAGLAAAVRQLHEDPDLFARMSEAAAQRVRRQSGFARTIARELALFVGNPAALPRQKLTERLVAAEARATRIALYGDVNLNIMDGSAIWAASLAEVLGGIADVRVALVMKARIHRTQVIARLLDMAPAVQPIEPELPERIGLTPAEATARLVALDAKTPFHALILRGLDVCHTAAQEAALRGRLWVYLTDIPQKAELMDAVTRQRIETIIDASAYVLCQTPQMRDYFVSQFPQACEKARLLLPMVPPLPARGVESVPDAPFRFAYAGKFAPRWGIRELFAAQEKLLSALPDAELHVFGDKIHNPADDPSFHPTVKESLATGKGLTWHGAVDRDALLRRLTSMHACWAYRDPAFERETLELSTKVLEYASLGLPMILARSQVFEALLGEDYPLFATTDEEAGSLLLELARVPAFRKLAAARLEHAAARYTFAAVRERLLDDGLIRCPLRRDS